MRPVGFGNSADSAVASSGAIHGYRADTGWVFCPPQSSPTPWLSQEGSSRGIRDPSSDLGVTSTTLQPTELIGCSTGYY